MTFDITTIFAACVAAVTSLLTVIGAAIIKGFWERNIQTFKLSQEHRYAQQKQLKDILSRNKIQLLNIAEQLNHRLWNFSENHSANWMMVAGDYSAGTGNYFRSFVYRFLAFFAWIRLIERQMIYVDSTFAGSSDLEFIKYLRSLPQPFCDVKMYTGLDYDHSYARDHFFRNDFERMAEVLIRESTVETYEQFCKSMRTRKRALSHMYQFFDGISPVEPRFRWDSLKAFHLLLMAFLNTFGYDFQKTSKRQINEIRARPRQSKVERNLLALLQRNKLDNNKAIKELSLGRHCG